MHRSSRGRDMLRNNFPPGLGKLQQRRREVKEALREAPPGERLQYWIRLRAINAWMGAW